MNAVAILPRASSRSSSLTAAQLEAGLLELEHLAEALARCEERPRGGPPRARLRAPGPCCLWFREKSLAEVATCTAPTPRTR